MQLRLRVAPSEAATRPLRWALEGVEVQRSSDGAMWYFPGSSEVGVPGILRSDDAAETAIFVQVRYPENLASKPCAADCLMPRCVAAARLARIH